MTSISHSPKNVPQKNFVEKGSSYFVFLDCLRDSGITNMFGAAPYLMEAFSMDRASATTILLEWMEQYGQRKEG